VVGAMMIDLYCTEWQYLYVYVTVVVGITKQGEVFWDDTEKSDSIK
jgi:hypothetical protein